MTKIGTAACVAVAIGVGLIVDAAHAEDISATGPQVSATQLIAAHGSAAEPVLRINYDTISDAEKGQMVIDIAPDFVSVKRTAFKESGTVLYDFRLKRVISLDETHHTFSNDSAYLMVDFRYIESFNRKMLRGVLGRLGVSKQLPQAQNPYWDQQSLSFLAPNDDKPVVETNPTAHGGMEYLVDGKVVAARFEPSTQALSADEKKNFARFLWNNSELHPIVIEAILASEKIPGEIEARNVMGNRQTVSVWKLKSVDRVTGNYPLTADYQSDLPQKKLGGPLRSILPTMLQAVSGHYATPPRSVESYRAALADASAKDATFQYYVLDNEFALQYGMGVMGCLSHRAEATDCADIQSVIQKYRADGRTMAMINSFGLEQKDVKAALQQRQAISRDGLSDPYMIDLWLGDAMTESGDIEGALSLIPNAIKGNPYVGGFYKDLGDAFEKSFQPEETWLCYDLARALPAGDKAPVVDGIAQKEQFLETQYPQFF